VTDLLEVTKGLDRGGMERIVVDIAVGRHQHGNETRVVVVNGTRRALAEELERTGVPVAWLPGSDRVGRRGLVALATEIRSARSSTIHAHGPWPIVAAALLRRSGQCAVGTVHAMWPDHRRLSRLAMRLVAWRLDALTTVSTAAQQALPSRLRRRSVVIPHGVQPDSPDSEVQAATWDIAVLASHRSAKGYPVLLEALAALERPVRVIVAGDGPDRDHHVALATRLGGPATIDWQPVTTDPRSVLRNSTICVIASVTESQPLVALDALACGIPVVGTDVGRIAELLADGGGRVVPANDPSALAAAISAMLTEMSDPSRARRHRSDAREAAAAWPLDTALDRYDDLFDELARRR
jgi:glycosyltransferase involved in cell wall biosynthesis